MILTLHAERQDGLSSVLNELLRWVNGEILLVRRFPCKNGET
jgi:hypothetical protein